MRDHMYSCLYWSLSLIFIVMDIYICVVNQQLTRRKITYIGVRSDDIMGVHASWVARGAKKFLNRDALYATM